MNESAAASKEMIQEFIEDRRRFKVLIDRVLNNFNIETHKSTHEHSGWISSSGWGFNKEGFTIDKIVFNNPVAMGRISEAIGLGNDNPVLNNRFVQVIEFSYSKTLTPAFGGTPGALEINPEYKPPGIVVAITRETLFSGTDGPFLLSTPEGISFDVFSKR